MEGREVLLIFEGPTATSQATWYQSGLFLPTWNFTAVHAYGVRQLLHGDEGFTVLERTVEHSRRRVHEPWRLAG